jgi:hypothetical protein
VPSRERPAGVDPAAQAIEHEPVGVHHQRALGLGDHQARIIDLADIAEREREAARRHHAAPQARPRVQLELVVAAGRAAGRGAGGQVLDVGALEVAGAGPAAADDQGEPQAGE